MVESIYFLKPAWCGTHPAGLWPEQGLQPVTRATALRRWLLTQRSLQGEPPELCSPEQLSCAAAAAAAAWNGLAIPAGHSARRNCCGSAANLALELAHSSFGVMASQTEPSTFSPARQCRTHPELSAHGLNLRISPVWCRTAPEAGITLPSGDVGDGVLYHSLLEVRFGRLPEMVTTLCESTSRPGLGAACATLLRPSYE